MRPFCPNAHYWQVYFDSNRMIRNTFGQAGFPAPEHHQFVHGKLEGAEIKTMKTAA